ncbi:MAG: MATE family efflux transporter [Bacteroidales bacterium]|nr:MATE family efflux transporter [Bacteroidales bacterium]MBR5054903.1 MATE family efflux transporter [Bacteroidales bacterium]
MALAGAAPTELGTERIGKLLKMYAVPGIIAQTAASLYNMVDSIYIGHIKDVGSYAISGLAVTFPLMNLSAALGTLVGVGAMTLISVLLGQKNYSTAGKVLSNVLTLNVVISILFTIVTLSFLDPILYFFGASDNTIPFARKYMTIILLGNVITHLYFGFNGIIRAAGNPKLAMGLTLFTVASNAILDPIFIFVLDLGIQGAALATVLCQTMALSYSMRYLSRKDNFLHFPRPLFQLDWRIAKQSLAIGLGPFLMNAASCLVALFINQQLRKYGGDLAIGAYGIVNRLTMLFVMICMGFNQGLQPIAGYNYGARQYSRVKEVFILTAKWEVLVTTLCFLVSELLPRQAVSLFTNDPQLIDFAAHGIKTMNIAFALVGFGMVSGNFFQCLGMVKKSIFLSLTRQLLFLLPFIYTLPIWLEEDGVWWSFPISDSLNIIVSAILIINIFRKFNKLNDGDDPSILGSTIS